MRYYGAKLHRDLYAVSVPVLPVGVRVLCLIALLLPVSDSFTPLDSVLKGGLSNGYVALMPRVLHSPPKTFHGGTNSRPLKCLKKKLIPRHLSLLPYQPQTLCGTL